MQKMVTFTSNKKLRSPCMSMTIVLLSLLCMKPMEVTCEGGQYAQTHYCPFQKSFIMMTKTKKHFFPPKNVSVNKSKKSSSSSEIRSNCSNTDYKKSSEDSNLILDKEEEKILQKNHRVGWLGSNSHLSDDAYNYNTAKNVLYENENSMKRVRGGHSSLTQLRDIRGGSSSVESEAESEGDVDVEEGSDEEEEEADASEAEEEDVDESEDEYEIEEEEDEDVYETEEEMSDDNEVAVDEDFEYDSMLMPSSMQSMGVTIGVMLASRNLDFSNAKIIKFARYGYIAYVIVSQIFFLYVRIQAKLIHDTTIITISNPVTNLVKNQLNTALSGSSNSNNDTGMAKTLTDKFLSSSSTVMDYDVNQSRKLMSGMFFSLAFMWYLHFKMNQVQPLLYQTASGILNLVYSPLFQVYVLGRNLERPFKPPIPAMMGNNDVADENSTDEVDADEQSVDEDQSEKEEELEEKIDEDDSDNVEDNTDDESDE